jgi:hypothetical protein
MCSRFAKELQSIIDICFMILHLGHAILGSCIIALNNNNMEQCDNIIQYICVFIIGSYALAITTLIIFLIDPINKYQDIGIFIALAGMFQLYVTKLIKYDYSCVSLYMSNPDLINFFLWFGTSLFGIAIFITLVRLVCYIFQYCSEKYNNSYINSNNYRTLII